MRGKAAEQVGDLLARRPMAARHDRRPRRHRAMKIVQMIVDQA